MALELVNTKIAGVVVLLGLTVLIQLTDCSPEDRHKIFLECLQESGASPEQVKKVFHGEDFGGDEKVKCFLKCIHVKAGYMDDSGKLNPQKFMEKLGEKIGQNKAAQIMANCKDSSGSNPCDTAFVFSECMKKQFKALGIELPEHV